MAKKKSWETKMVDFNAQIAFDIDGFQIIKTRFVRLREAVKELIQNLLKRIDAQDERITTLETQLKNALAQVDLNSQTLEELR